MTCLRLRTVLRDACIAHLRPIFLFVYAREVLERHLEIGLPTF